MYIFQVHVIHVHIQVKATTSICIKTGNNKITHSTGKTTYIILLTLPMKLMFCAFCVTHLFYEHQHASTPALKLWVPFHQLTNLIMQHAL